MDVDVDVDADDDEQEGNGNGEEGEEDDGEDEDDDEDEAEGSEYEDPSTLPIHPPQHKIEPGIDGAGVGTSLTPAPFVGTDGDEGRMDLDEDDDDGGETPEDEAVDPNTERVVNALVSGMKIWDGPGQEGWMPHPRGASHNFT